MPSSSPPPSRSQGPPAQHPASMPTNLLAQQFDPTIDAQQAEIELDGYHWHPLDKKALGVVPFRGTSSLSTDHISLVDDRRD